MRKLIILTLLLLATIGAGAQKKSGSTKPLLSKSECEFLSNGVLQKDGVYKIKAVGTYLDTSNDKENKRHAKNVREKIDLLNKVGTFISHETAKGGTAKEAMLVTGNKEFVYMYDIYSYKPNEQSEYYQAYKVWQEGRMKEEMDFLHSGKQLNNGVYYLKITDKYMLAAARNAQSPKKIENRKSIITRHGLLLKSECHQWKAYDGEVDEQIYYYVLLEGEDGYFGPNQTVDVDDMKNIGRAVLWKQGSGNDKSRFYRVSDMKWSGELENGAVDGKGEGLYSKGEDVVLVKGTFEGGIPMGNVVMTERDYKGRLLQNTVCFHPFAGDLARVKINDDWAFVDNQLNLLFDHTKIRRLFANGAEDTGDTIAVTNYAANGRAIASKGALQYEIDKQGNLVGLSNDCMKSITAMLDQDIAEMTNAFTTKNINSREVNIGQRSAKLNDYAKLLKSQSSLGWEKKYPAVAKKWKLHDDISDMCAVLADTVNHVQVLHDIAGNKESYSMGIYTADFIKSRADKARTTLKNPQFRLKDATAANTARKLLTQKENEFAKAFAAAEPIVKKQRQERADREERTAVVLGTAVAVVGGLMSLGNSSSSSSDTPREVKKEEPVEPVQPAKPAEPDYENMPTPTWKYTSEWEKTSPFPFVSNSTAKNEHAENQERRIRYSDYTTGKIARIIGTKGFWAESGIRFKTEEEAAAAEYIFKKYGKVRKKNKMDWLD